MAEIDFSDGDDGSGVDVPSSGSRLPYFLGTRLVVLAIVVGVLFLVRPLIHGVVYSALYSPSGVVLIGGGTITALVLWFLPPWRLEGDRGGSNLSSVLFADAKTTLSLVAIFGKQS